ncbi:uncharacterized protein LOC131074397 [Cryptomeria japonica]|uniref:uncharacterized protein LOC131074397 n=1 Tax=Cryptomeria japonica TaxID=3369 RepID=UPI0027DA6794|nr:uncharacterized protein LOC131074397 [Cryptomeria japonica]XP_057867005.2 uncharacterized protein LOC131074397 [Cryptomeria japonica]
METGAVDGSHNVEIVPDEPSQNCIESDMPAEHDAVPISEPVEEVVKVETVENGASDMADKALDVEENLDPSEQLTIDLDVELIHTKDNEEESILPNKMLNKDELNEQEKLKDFELETTMWRMSFSESASDVFKFKDDTSLSEKLEEITKYALALKENELFLKEMLAKAEFKIKGLENKLDTQSRLLEQEIKIGAPEEDELDNEKAMSTGLETDLKCLKEKVLDLEEQLKSSKDENEEYKKLVEQSEEECIKSFESALELDNLLVITESGTKEMEKLIILLQKEISELYQNLKSNESRQEPLNRTETEPLKVEGQSMQSIYLSPEEKSEDYLVIIKELEALLLASRQKEQELQEALTVAEDRISFCEEMTKGSTCRLPEDENSVEVLQGALKDAQEKIKTLELNLLNPSGREIKHQSRLKDSEPEAQLMVQENSTHATSRVKELEQLLELQAIDEENKLQAEKENGACADTEVKNLKNKLNLLEDHVKESDEQASQAYVSELAKEVELQVLHAKLAELDIVVQNLQARFMVAETRARGAEAERSALTYTNSKLSEELANLQAYMDEIQTTLHHIDSEKESVAYQLISTTKNINGLTKQLADERQHLQKEIFSLVSVNLDLTRKYVNAKEVSDTILSHHEINVKKSYAEEASLTENLKDIKVGCSNRPSMDMNFADLQQKLEQDLKRVARDSKDTQRDCQTVPVSGFGSSEHADSARNLIPAMKTIIKSMSAVVLVLIMGLVIGKLI